MGRVVNFNHENHGENKFRKKDPESGSHNSSLNIPSQTQQNPSKTTIRKVQKLALSAKQSLPTTGC
jgi:hypothetical protein